MVKNPQHKGLRKTPTGISGLDQVLSGGLPAGRITLLNGIAGSGKTFMGFQFLLRGITEYNEPGVALVFEETGTEIRENFAGMHQDIAALERDNKLVIDYVHVERHDIEETGEYDLSPIFVRLDSAIRKVKAKRVLIDTLEVLFTGLKNEAIVRSELRRLFRWLKERGVTAVITAEAGRKELTRYGMEEYVADCVIVLDHRVTEQVSTRRLRVVKYRGSEHGTNEYPFLMDSKGITVVPITSLGLSHEASTKRVSSGIDGLDGMLGNKGFYRGSSVLITGSAGTGKSSFAAAAAHAACARGERVCYFAFEESPSQIFRNMRSIGMDLEPWVKKGLLMIDSTRPTAVGLEGHLATLHRMVEEHRPGLVLIDPITNLITVGDIQQVKSMLTRLIDFLKMEGITTLFTNLTVLGAVEDTAVGISSLMDAWVLLRDDQIGNFRQRSILVLKARGMSHSTESRGFHITDEGIILSNDRKERSVSKRVGR